MKSVILLSGGLDSAVCLYEEMQVASCYTLCMDYHQTHQCETLAASELAVLAGVEEHCELDVTFPFKESPLLNPSFDHDQRMEMEGRIQREVSPVYFPARNTVFLSLALSWAESLGAEKVIFGATADDRLFPDCLPPYVAAMNAVSAAGTATRPQVVAPLNTLQKEEVVAIGDELNVPFEETVSCYRGMRTDTGWLHCGICDACRGRRNAFYTADVLDPTEYGV